MGRSQSGGGRKEGIGSNPAETLDCSVLWSDLPSVLPRGNTRAGLKFLTRGADRPKVKRGVGLK